MACPHRYAAACTSESRTRRGVCMACIFRINMCTHHRLSLQHFRLLGLLFFGRYIP